MKRSAGMTRRSAIARGDSIETRRCRPYTNRGIIRAAQNRYDQALADYDHALTLDPEDAETWQNRRARARGTQAVRPRHPDFGRAIQLNPGFVEAHYYRGRADLEMRHFAEAISDYSAVIA